jgi:hypothetical protein
MATIFPILDIGLQVSAAVASIGRVYTPHRLVGRRWNAAALLFIALDYSANYIHDWRDIHFTGALVFWALTARTAVILGLQLDGDDRWRKLSRALIAGAAWMACAGIVIFNQYHTGRFDPKTLTALGALSNASIDIEASWYLAKHVIDPTVIALTGLGLGCLGEVMGDMVRTRRCIFGMGVLMAGFALASHNWGQLFKNIVSDVTATVISAIEFRDRPLINWFPSAALKVSVAVHRFRSRYLTIPPDLLAKLAHARTWFSAATLKISLSRPSQLRPSDSGRPPPATGHNNS